MRGKTTGLSNLSDVSSGIDVKTQLLIHSSMRGLGSIHGFSLFVVVKRLKFFRHLLNQRRILNVLGAMLENWPS
jgi:hypothetical protein